MVGAADGDSERIGRVGRNIACLRQQAADHEGDLILVRPAGSDDGELHFPGGVFVHFEPRASERGHRSAAGLSQQQRRFRVDVDEGFLDRCLVGFMRVAHGAELGGEFGEAVSQISLGVGMDHAVGDPGEPGSVHCDHAPPCVAKAGIDAEDSDHLIHSSSLADIERIENTSEVNGAETNTAEPVHMTRPVFPMTRRSALKLGLGGLAVAAVAQPAFATPVSFPLRIAYARVSPDGFVQIRFEEQESWTRMATRLGGLISALTPLQPAGMLGGGLPKIEGGANCSLVARQMAEDAGYNQVILYATMDGQPPQVTSDNWFMQAFNDLMADVAKDGRAMGEAQLLSTGGGMPMATATADAAPRDLLNLFDGGRNPEREVLGRLVGAMERQLQDMARSAYEGSRSISD